VFVRFGSGLVELAQWAVPRKYVMRKYNRAFLRLFMLSAPLAAISGACSDSSEEEKDAVELSASCTLNSECKEPLICAFARCHAQCADSARDCPADQRCVSGEEEDAETSSKPGVCQLKDEEKCTRNNDCKAGQFCAKDGECRDGCEEDGDCLSNQTCTPSGACADQKELEDDGDIPDAPSEGGAGGAPGGAPSEGGAGGEPGGTPSEGGAGGEPGGTPSEGGAGGEPGSEPATGDDCSLQDPDNSERDSATPYVFGTEVEGCLQSIADVDFFEFTTPAEPLQGGWVVANLRDVGTDGNYYLRIFSATDNAQIQQFYGSVGSNGAIWIPAAPGQLFRVSVEPYSIIPPEYTFSAEFTAVPDLYEPNDSRQDAVPIEVGEEVEAYLFRGFDSSEAPGNDEDWYEVDLSAGSVTATLDQPDTVASYIYLHDSTGAQVGQVYGAAGVDTTLEETGLAIGTYYFRVVHYSGAMTAGTGTTAPAIEPEPYLFQVTQD
jgi:hypothetical protein